MQTKRSHNLGLLIIAVGLLGGASAIYLHSAFAGCGACTNKYRSHDECSLPGGVTGNCYRFTLSGPYRCCEETSGPLVSCPHEHPSTTVGQRYALERISGCMPAPCTPAGIETIHRCQPHPTCYNNPVEEKWIQCCTAVEPPWVITPGGVSQCPGTTFP